MSHDFVRGQSVATGDALSSVAATAAAAAAAAEAEKDVLFLVILQNLLWFAADAAADNFFLLAAAQNGCFEYRRFQYCPVIILTIHCFHLTKVVVTLI